ncbi:MULTISPECIES: hypothetical protein [unclassified Streptomyces]|uniref:hypothetical protein n=1 Tax=unclassified Streptomyces TaxID=2593676 RepID=UPI002440F390|nr:hypothetical protein [Streptomyces sp. DH41]MDG9721659.1 hypothetical protein [Streptomyces sp. DH41]
MNEDDCFPLLLSQRERSTNELGVQRVVSEVEVADFPSRHDPSEDDDALAGSPDFPNTIPVLPDESPPAA